MSTPVTVIGIDPGSCNTGWGIVSELSGVLKLVTCGVIKPGNKEAFADRLSYIFHELCSVIELYKPEEASIEQIFTAYNALTALKLGQARGAALVACASQGISIHDYQPTTIKKTVVGYGSATKEQVGFMVGKLLCVKSNNWSADTSDALATAICHLTMRRFLKHTQNTLKQKTT